MNGKSIGFTLIELLIVVAFVGILAAIAIVNFLEVQARGKVARVQSDMRSLATCLEAYCVDNDAYPPCGYAGDVQLLMPPLVRLVPLTTPITYISKVPIDPFKELDRVKQPACQIKDQIYRYREESGFRSIRGAWPLGALEWELNSFGPDGDCDGGLLVVQYDPTNGTISNGDISRVGP